MVELMIIFLAVAALCCVLCVMEGVLCLVDRIWPGSIERLWNWLFR